MDCASRSRACFRDLTWQRKEKTDEAAVLCIDDLTMQAWSHRVGHRGTAARLVKKSMCRTSSLGREESRRPS